jgi:hypothetical protein
VSETDVHGIKYLRKQNALKTTANVQRAVKNLLGPLLPGVSTQGGHVSCRPRGLGLLEAWLSMSASDSWTMKAGWGLLAKQMKDNDPWAVPWSLTSHGALHWVLDCPIPSGCHISTGNLVSIGLWTCKVKIIMVPSL